MTDPKKVTVAKLPTGAGKGYIAAIVAQFYKLRDQRVAIVTSNTYLVR